jgi:hypothetical protein
LISEYPFLDFAQFVEQCKNENWNLLDFEKDETLGGRYGLWILVGCSREVGNRFCKNFCGFGCSMSLDRPQGAGTEVAVEMAGLGNVLIGMCLFGLVELEKPLSFGFGICKSKRVGFEIEEFEIDLVVSAETEPFGKELFENGRQAEEADFRSSFAFSISEAALLETGFVKLLVGTEAFDSVQSSFLASSSQASDFRQVHTVEPFRSDSHQR